MPAKRRQPKDASPSVVPAKSSVQAGFLIEIAALLILAGIPFALGKYFEFNQSDPYDGGSYAYSAWHVLQGAKFGSDEVASAQPATFLVNYLGVAAFGYSELGAKIIQMILQFASLALMFYTLRRCFGKAAAVLCTSVASIYLSAPLIAKFGNVKEQYMVAFMIITTCFLLLTIKTKNEWLWAAVGAFAVWPYFFKPTGISTLAATGLYVILFSLPQRRWITFLNRLLLLAGGAIIGVSPLVLFFSWKIGRLVFLSTFPLLLIKAIIALAFLGYAILALSKANKQFNLISRLKGESSIFWPAAAAAIIAMHLIGGLMIRIQPGASGQDVWNYLYATPFFEMAQYLCFNIYGYFTQTWMSLGTRDIYITGSRTLMGFSQQYPIVLRYYAALKLPVILAVVSILILWIRFFLRAAKKIAYLNSQDWMAIYIALWWVVDMGMIWVSPRSYEQYYLPMCASAAMLAGYGIWRFMERFNPAENTAGKFLTPTALIVMTAMVWPIFAGIKYSPFSGTDYGRPSRGYAQSWTAIQNRQKEVAPWEPLSDYIRTHSSPEDRMYVWGWYPGMYVRAQRLSASPQATEGNMHILPLWQLSVAVNKLMNSFTQHPPKYIVDSRKTEFPWTVWPLELWPEWILRPQNQLRIPKEMEGPYRGFLSTEKNKIDNYEAVYTSILAKNFSPEEAERFKAMKPFRDYVMQNYKVAGIYGPHVLFVRTAPAGTP